MNTRKNTPRGLSRRGFLKGGGAASGVAVLGSTAAVAALTRTAHGAAWMLPSTSPETPTSHQIETLNMIADTVLPNADGDPGGIEADSFSTINDPYYGLNPYISEVVSDIDDTSYWGHLHFTKFKYLDLDDRTTVLRERLGELWTPSWLLPYRDAYIGLIAMTKLSFFGAAQNSVGTDYIGFPGPAYGYYPPS